MKNIIIDAHAHSDYYYNFFSPNCQPEGMLKGMDNVGIDFSCITPNMSLTSDIVKGNERMHEVVTTFPTRFKGYIAINPNYEDHIKSDLGKYMSNENVIGIKIHNGCHQAHVRNKIYDYAYSYVNERKGVILFHTWDLDTVKNIEQISDLYPDASIVMGHFGAYPDNMRYCAKIINERENLYGDNCLSMNREGNIEWLVSMVGSKKLLFGTDLPFFDPRPNIGRIINSELSETDKNDVLGLNMKRILDRIIK